MADATPWLRHRRGRLGSGEEEVAPEDGAGFLRRYTFWWSFPTIRRAQRLGHLDEKDLPILPLADEPANLFAKFSAAWEARGTASAPSVFTRTMLWSAQRQVCLSALLHQWVAQFSTTVDPILLRALLDRVNGDADFGTGMFLVSVQTLLLLCNVAASQRAWHVSTRTMNNARSTSVHSVFRRALVGVSDNEFDVGALTNYMATDADKFGKTDGLIVAVAQWTWTVASLPVVVFFLSQLVGLAAVGAVVVVIVSGSFINKALMSLTKPLVGRVQAVRDERASLMTELVRGIRTVKLQVWEEAWHSRIAAVRAREMRLLVTVQALNALNSLVGNLLSLAVPTTVFAWHVLVDDAVLDSTTAFVTLGWLSMLQNALQSLPAAYSLYTNLAPSMSRLGRFLAVHVDPTAGETPHDRRERDVLLHEIGGSPSPSRGSWLTRDLEYTQYVPSTTALAPAIVARGADLGYPRSHRADADGAESTVVMSAVDFELKQGGFAVVAGPVGSGKSTLLAALAGARSPLSGVCQARGRRAFAAQKPFLLNASVRDNILFTRAFDQERYQDAIHRTALEPDLRALANGDETMVGESGVQLSGGQKSRVALARALYSDADIVVCDDVLSAVDAHTAKHLWDEALIGGLVAQGRTLVLATHQVQYLSRPEVSKVVILQGGTIRMQGPWHELLAKGTADLPSLVGSWDRPNEDDDNHAAGDVAAPAPADPEPHGPGPRGGDTECVSLGLHEFQSAMEALLRAREGHRITPTLIEDIVAGLHGRNEERPQQGMIAWIDFRVYLSAFGSRLGVASLLLASVCVAALGIAGNAWLSVWSASGDPSKQHSYLAIYVGIGVASGLCNLVQSFVLTFCALRASRAIHTAMLRRLLSAPMSFFDTVASGRILNRFLQDLDSIDNYVPSSILEQLSRTLTIVTQLSLIYSQAPWILLSLPFLIPPYIEVFRYVRVSNRDCKRIEASAHAPVYAHFGESLAGRETIRAFGLEGAFVRRNLELVYSMASGKYGNQAVGKWAQATLSQWSCLLYLLSGVACVTMSARGAMTGAQVGLVLLYAASLNGTLMNYSVSCAVLESQFVSVERVAEYTRLPIESGADSELAEGPSDEARLMAHAGASTQWPLNGAISMENVCLRYAPHLMPALRGVDLEVAACSKVALCGRTGCGKSSLLGALTRLYPMTAGRIQLDGRDVATAALPSLRHALRVVSQDAFLVSGTVSENLVPISCMGPAARADALGTPEAFADLCWHVLRLVGMADRIRDGGGLDGSVQAGGGNFSVGERQLLTLARALMPLSPVAVDAWRPPPVLLADEATASVDLVADARIHDVLLGLNSTLVMVCHRLQYIRRFDKVAVLEAGQVVECAPPGELLAAEPPSRLKLLCAAAGALDAAA